MESKAIATARRQVPAAFGALAVTSLATAGIHFAVMGEHFQEFALFGLFFAAVAWLQALWALGVAVAPTRSLLLAGIMGNAVVVVVWIVSRTTGLPLGPEPGSPEPAAFLDMLSTVLEIVIVVAATAAVLRRPRVAQPGRGGFIAVAVLTIALVVLTTAAVAASGDDEGHGGDERHAEGAAATNGPVLSV